MFGLQWGVVVCSALTMLACVSERETRGPVPLPPATTPPVTPTPNHTPSITVNSPTPVPLTVSPTPSPSPTIFPGDITLVIPVVGIRPEQLRDTFSETRSQGRIHEAIDILAPQDTKVVAAADGTIARLFTSEKGGLTIYQLSADQRLVFYYAHLNRYAEHLTEKQSVRQGDLLGYVGDTGNAQPGNYHLHFAMWEVEDPKRIWDGINLNPYEFLRRAPM
ncbi:MAG TPA: M23 family metallopeptidase, partial [Blastocatellia bacterium]|nr:M23 family metallopeptidase [Blastocatellia bacterium]